MRKILTLLVITWLSSCGVNDQEITRNCLVVEDVVTPAGCYDQGLGLTLTAANVPKFTALQWVIVPLKDSTGGGTHVAKNFTSTSNSVVIPDSLLSGFSGIGIAYVGKKDCSSPIYFSFVRRAGPGSTCTSWHLKEQYLKGD